MIINIIVDSLHNGKRLDLFLTSCIPDATRSQVQQWLELGAIKLNEDVIQKASLKVREGQSYQIEIPDPIPAEPVPVQMDLDIFYEDDHILVLNKPVGLVVHPAAGHYDDTLVNGLLFHCKDLSGIGGVLRPGIVHRLDKDTSGLMVVAKSDKAHHNLSLQFQEKGTSEGILREYIGLTWGIPYPRSGNIETQIGRDYKDRQKMAILTQGGKHAKTAYQVEETYQNHFAKIRFTLFTGRTHQIRVHCQHLNIPLIGDPLYGGRLTTARKKIAHDDVLMFNRQALHAHVLAFHHPITNQRLSFSSDFPLDMKNLINILEVGQFVNDE